MTTNAPSKSDDIYRSTEQRQCAGRIAEHLASAPGLPLLLEGAAGLGKTRAYLAPLLATGKPVAIAVPTRALAAQLLASTDLAAVRRGQSISLFTPRRHFESQSQYIAHRQACMAADVLVCTHQAALLDVLADGALLGLKDRFAVLFDEADQLPDAAALRFDCAVDAATFAVLGVKPGADHAKTLAALQKAFNKWQSKLDEPAVVKAAMRAIADALDAPVWYQTVGLDEQGAMRLHHQLPARALKRLLGHPRLTFVSATLTVNGSFQDFQSALGIKEISPWSAVIEPKQHGRLEVVLQDWSTEAPNHFEQVAAHVDTLHGNVLVITTAHSDAAHLGALIATATVRASEDETTAAAALRMQSEGNRVLVAAGAWAGLDTAIHWSHVVMPKAPYGPPTLLDDHAVTHYVHSRNMAVRRFRQGLARGLRSPDAHCTLHLLDGRFARVEFVNALPMRFAKAYQARFTLKEYRTRQADFRRLMFAQFNGRCPITGCDEASALEAAHLGAPGGWRTNHTHGVLLRKDLHSVMDAGKLRIENGVVCVDLPHYRQFNGMKLW